MGLTHRQPFTTFWVHSRYSLRRSTDQSAGGEFSKSLILQILSAILSCFSRDEACRACLIWSSFLVAFGSDLSSVTSRTILVTSISNTHSVYQKSCLYPQRYHIERLQSVGFIVNIAFAGQDCGDRNWMIYGDASLSFRRWVLCFSAANDIAFNSGMKFIAVTPWCQM